MIITYPLFDGVIEFEENKINVLIIENGTFFRKAVFDAVNQAKGEEGEFILSENFKIIDFSKNAEVIINFSELDFDSRKFAAKINKMAENASEELENESMELLSKINIFAASLATLMDIDVSFSEKENISDIIKLFDFKIDREGKTLGEQLLEYMKMCRMFFGKKLFIFVNLKSYLSEEEAESFYKSVLYEKYDVLLLESHQRGAFLEKEYVTVIDEDLCEI